MEKLSACPVCGNTSLSPFLKAKDYFLSGEDFSIDECQQCGFKFTNPRPGKEEISRYYESEDYISHDTHKKSLINIVYKIARNYSLKRKYRLVKKWSQGENLLDIGCGTGEFLKLCMEKGMKVTGIEPNEKAALFARTENKIEVFPEEHLEKIQNPVFDIITMWHVLEHVHDLNERMEKIHQILKPSGTLIVAVPNSSAFDAEHYKNFWAAYDLPRHLYHFSPETISALSKKHHFSIRKILPMKMDAYYISLLSEKYANGKSGYFKALKNGFSSNYHAATHQKRYSSLIFVLAMENGRK